MTADALVAVGKDCDCGHPLVWRRGQQWCAVYGSHPVILTRRNPDAPFSDLVRMCMAAPTQDTSRVRNRRLRAVA